MNKTTRNAAPPRGERALLAAIRARLPRRAASGLRLGAGDDCALLRLRRGEEVAVTTDFSIEGRHFHQDWHTPESVGHRCLARGLSDLAAMGARPVAAFLSLAVPKNLTRATGRRAAWAERFYDGLLALAAEHGVPLAGGDLAEAPLAVADIVLVGAVPEGRALLRSGARPGDRLYVTGTLGGAARGLNVLQSLAEKTARKTKATEAIWAAHLWPQPRLSQGWWLQRRGVATAALDVSDGLATDLAHLCEESGVRAEIDAERLPLGLGATRDEALYGGEDYELLFTAPAAQKVPAKIAGVTVTEIGRIEMAKRNAPLITLRTETGTQALTGSGWEHFG